MTTLQCVFQLCVTSAFLCVFSEVNDRAETINRRGTQRSRREDFKLGHYSFVYIVANVLRLRSVPGPGGTLRPPVRSAAACDSDPRCRYSPEAKFLDHSNRVETGSWFPQPV